MYVKRIHTIKNGKFNFLVILPIKIANETTIPVVVKIKPATTQPV